MNPSLKAIPLFQLLMVLSFLSCSVVLGSPDSSEFLQNQTLYFQPIKAHAFVYWLMNTSVPSGPGMNQQPVSQFFTSPQLVEEFTFQTITAKIYHEKVPSDRGTFTLEITAGYLDRHGSGFYPVNSSEITLVPDSEVNSFSIKFDHKLLEEEYLCLRIFITNLPSGYPLDMYWGNSTYPSQISYEGTAVYVSEFPSFLILPLFMTTTLLAVIIHRRKHFWM